MKILKPGKVEQRKFVCFRCGCVFVATNGEIEFDTIAEQDVVCCPQRGCGVYVTWDSGEPYEEPTPTQSNEALLADLIHSSNAIDFNTSIKLAKWLTENGVTFREG